MLSKLLPKSSYARNVITLMTGTAVAQTIPVAISPILTRLYGPEEFGVFALYMAAASIASVLVTGRYELAILLPKRDRDAMHIVALSITLSVILSALLLLLVWQFNAPITRLLGAPDIAPWLYWVPASTLLMGIYTSLNYWSNRKAQYQRLAISRVVQNSTASLGQLGVGTAKTGATGLVVGQLAGQLLATTVLARMVAREDHALIAALSKSRAIALAKKYRDFPKFLIVAHAFNTASSHAPVILLTALFDTATAGFYTLIQRVFGAPMSLVASALGDVFRQEASQAYIHTGACKTIYQKTFFRLLAISIVPFLVFFFIAPDFFALVFGAPWRIAGEYAQILVPMFFLQFITSPISQVAVIAQKQNIDLLWQISLFALILMAFAIGKIFGNLEITLTLFSLVFCLMYAIAGIINYRLSSGAHD